MDSFDLRLRCLELAHARMSINGAQPATIVEEAEKYFAFVSGDKERKDAA